MVNPLFNPGYGGFGGFYPFGAPFLGGSFNNRYPNYYYPQYNYPPYNYPPPYYRPPYRRRYW
ncbi:hypothetical protein MKZ17_04675 [Solibacillus sp. FSL R7-0682]|uniref:hypothetical protein n=1 Tax=Solibacillus sp. FSL R7-0682 TaxID=2921690 RepID=UPI0030F59EE7